MNVMNEFIAAMLYVAADHTYRFDGHTTAMYRELADAMADLWYAGAWEYFR